MNKLLKYLVLLICTMYVNVSNATTYYLLSSGALNAETPGNWNTIAAGGGTAATNFTTANDIFIIPTSRTGTFSGSATFGSNVTLRILGTGKAKIGNTGSATVTINGTLDCQGTTANSVYGLATGTFIVSDNATVMTTNLNGLVSAASSNIATISNRLMSYTPSSSVTYMFVGVGTHLITGLPSTVANLTIGPKAIIAFSSNQTVTGTLTIKSNSTGTGSIGNSAGTITGTIKVERYIPASRKFRFLSSPVVSGASTQWRNNGTNTSGIGIQITGSGSNFDPSGTSNPSAFSYNTALAGSSTTVATGATNDPGWTAFTDGNTTLVNGKGYRVLVRGDRSIDLFTAGQSANNTTIYTSGTYPTMPVVISVTKTGTNTNSGFNLVGNPVPSAISWSSVTRSSVSGTYYTYSPSGGYVSWNGSVGSATGTISSSQAFFVVATAASGSITVSESTKSTGAGGSFFKTSISNCLKLTLRYDSLISDDQYIHFRDDAADTLEMDKDGFHLTNPSVNFYSMDSAGIKYSINCLSTSNINKDIPLGLDNTVNTNYKLLIYGLASFSRANIYLKDNLLGNITEITNDSFVVDIDHSLASTQMADTRFVILVRNLTTKVDTKSASNSTVSIYPNPTINKLNIVVNKPVFDPYSYEIYTQSGSKIASGILDHNINQIQTDELSAGMYILKITNESSIETLYFIK